MKYLRPYSGKGDPEGWLENYEAASRSEKWNDSQMLACISLKLAKRAQEWFTNFASQEKPKEWEAFTTLFLEEFGNEDLQTTLARCYRIGQKKSEDLKAYLNRFRKY